MSTRQGIRTLDWTTGRTRRVARSDARVVPATMALTFLIAVSIGALCFVAIRQTTMIRDLAARCDSARQLLIGIEEVNRTLKFEIEQAFSLARVSQFARQRLGMIEPTNIRYVPLSLVELP